MVALGDKVRDSVSGFEGIAVSSHNYLHGCTRINVQPPVGDDGKLPDTATFDEPQLVAIEVAAVKVDPVAPAIRTGGPNKYPDVRRQGDEPTRR